jgi:hypothetical protein
MAITNDWVMTADIRDQPAAVAADPIALLGQLNAPVTTLREAI